VLTCWYELLLSGVAATPVALDGGEGKTFCQRRERYVQGLAKVLGLRHEWMGAAHRTVFEAAMGSQTWPHVLPCCSPP